MLRVSVTRVDFASIVVIGRSATVSPYTGWLSKVSESDVLMAALGSGGVVTVDMGGYVRLWETGSDTLQRSLLEWRNMIGSEDGRPLQVNKYRSVDFVKMQPAVSLNTTGGRCYFKNDFHLDVTLHTCPCLTDFCRNIPDFMLTRMFPALAFTARQGGWV